MGSSEPTTGVGGLCSLNLPKDGILQHFLQLRSMNGNASGVIRIVLELIWVMFLGKTMSPLKAAAFSLSICLKIRSHQAHWGEGGKVWFFFFSFYELWALKDSRTALHWDLWSLQTSVKNTLPLLTSHAQWAKKGVGAPEVLVGAWGLQCSSCWTRGWGSSSGSYGMEITWITTSLLRFASLDQIFSDRYSELSV